MYYFVISMFDEHKQVKDTLEELKLLDSRVFLIQSDDGSDFLESCDIDFKKKLPNLEHQFEDKRRLPSHAICRNMSEGFTAAYKASVDLDETPTMVVGLTGDTLITDCLMVPSLKTQNALQTLR